VLLAPGIGFAAAECYTIRMLLLIALLSVPSFAAETELPKDPLHTSSQELKNVNRKPVKPMEKLVVKGSCTDPDGTHYSSDDKGYNRCLKDQAMRENESQYLTDPNAPKNTANKAIEFRF
jgi:hypothetical protein